MFDNQRYMTIGIKNTIPAELVILMWTMIDELRENGQCLDYLQVFKLTESNGKQHVLHSQEVPQFQQEMVFEMLKRPVQAKIFVIDDQTHSTMLLASEY